MIVHRQVGLAMVAIAFLAGAVYCYAGYAMVASFSVAHPDRSYDRAAVLYSAGMIVCLVGAAAAGVAAWRADRPRRRS